ncbi:MAG: M1 family aminopeptidase [bacterium]
MRRFLLTLAAVLLAAIQHSVPASACRYEMEQVAAEQGLSGLTGWFAPDPLHLIAPSRPFDTEHIRLDLDVDFDNASVSGNVQQRLRSLQPGLDVIQLNCVDMQISAVSIDDSPVSFEYPVVSDQLTSWMLIDDADDSRQTLYIRLSEPLDYGQLINLRIDYSCSPQTGLYFQPGEAGQYTEVWSQGEGESNRWWIPCFDYPNDKASYEGIFRVPEGFYALSNGNLLSREDHDGITEFHWSMEQPQVSYLITLAAAEYEVYEDSWRDVQLLYVCPPGTDRATAMRCVGVTPDIMECFSERIGIDYPYEKYAQVAVQNFIFGGMENTTATTMHARLIYDEGEAETRDETGLIAHELAHQWWGDMVTMREWNHMWLNEGFAKYFEEVYRDWDEGDDAMRVSMDGSHRAVIRSDNRTPRPMVTDFYNRTDDRNNNDIYTRGASVLHMLRGIIGDELFFAVLKHYGNKHRFDFAETPDLQTSVKEVTGQNLDWFFEQWVYMAGHPQLKVTQNWERERGNLALTIAQTQEVKDLVPLFRLPLQVEITTASAPHLYEIEVEQASEVFNFPVDGEPLMVIVDKGDWLLKELEMERSREQWLYMLEHGDGPSRQQAIRALKQWAGNDEVFAALSASIADAGELRPLRLEALDSLTDLRDERTLALLMELMDSPEGRLRRDSAGMLRNFKGKEGVNERLLMALHNDRAWDVRSRALDSLVALDYEREKCIEECLYLISLGGDRNNMVRSGINALGRLRAVEQLDYVKELAAPGNSREYRHTAIGTYADLMERVEDGKRKGEAAEYVATMLSDPWSRTRQSVIGTLAGLKVRDSIEPLRAMAELEEVQWIADYAKRSADEIDSFREERVRLEDLDAKLLELQRQVEELQQTVNQLNREKQEQEIKP